LELLLQVALDQPPPQREIAIIWRQSPDRVQMIGQNDEGIDREGIAPPRRGDCSAHRAGLVAAPTDSP